MEEIKEAFTRVKEDIDFLKKELDNFKFELFETRQSIIDICEIIYSLKLNNNFNSFSINLPSFNTNFPNLDISLDNQTNNSTGNNGVETNSTNISTDNKNIKSLKDQIYNISKGNEGVQTDRQTDISTDRQMKKGSDNQNFSSKLIEEESFQFTDKSFDSTLDILNSLDNIRKEIRLKFKRLTEQELLVFSTIYQLEEELGYSDYKSLSKKLKLTESSIRDYVSRLISKDIPIEKSKINNKEIKLSISSSLKKITSLNTILQLRDL
jgi:hypothetical protein